jgi:diaminopropionate ammonia-lyase
MEKHHLTFDPARPKSLLAHCPAYAPTPLVTQSFEGQTVFIKDETNRMGLGAFKALGGVYAVARMIEKHTGISFTDGDRPSRVDMTFVTASAGNHGMAVAAGGQLFGAKVRIYLAHTVPEDFALRLQEKGAEVVRAGDTYEESVEAATEDAARTGAWHLADGSWPGYTEPPRLVMEGYTVIAEEMRAHFEENGNWPTHVFLQAGVGGLAAATAYMIRKNWTHQPKIIIVEPDAAPCLKASVATGKMTTVQGPISNMGRLDCKVPSMIAFEILKDTADEFVTISDKEAEQATQKAADMGLKTTPSGVAGLAALLKYKSPMPHPLVIFSEGSVDNE